MLNGRTAAAILATALLAVNVCFAQTLQEDWGNFLSALRANELDSAKGYGQAVLDARPKPMELLALIAQNQEDNATLLEIAGRTADTDDAGLAELGQVTGQILDVIAEGRVDCWDETLHYMKIGRLDLAKDYGQLLLNSDPDPVQLLNLSKENPQGYEILVRAGEAAPDAELAGLSRRILDVIEQGRFVQRTDDRIIAEEVRRLSGTERGWLIAVKRLRNAGEYAIPFMLDAIVDPSREEELPYIVRALPEIGRDGIRPLTAALQTKNVVLKAQIITALGKTGYPQSQAYLKYIIENEDSAELRELARNSIMQINPKVLELTAAELFYQLAESYYYHAESLAPATDADLANIWFWDSDTQQLDPREVDKGYFHELMAMRACEWALKADARFGSAISLWLAAFFKAESVGVERMPDYFGERHGDALFYAATAGVEYLHEALARAVRDRNAYVALGVIEALGTTAGEKSLLYRMGPAQPLVQALQFNNRMVRYSAAIAIAAAGPKQPFVESRLVVANLAEALVQSAQPGVERADGWNEQIAGSYAVRAAQVMLKLAQERNAVLDLSAAQGALVRATSDKRIQTLASQILAHLASPGAQRAITVMALDPANDLEVRISAFDSLAASAKLNGYMLTEAAVDSIYALISSDDTDEDLRKAAAAAYGALNLPSRKVKNLILDQAKS